MTENLPDHKFNKHYARDPKTYYLNRFISLKCAVDLLYMGMFPNAKEISETFGMFEAARLHVPGLSVSDKEVTVVVVGDGTKPRTGAFCAFMSAWSCWSIDPKLDDGYHYGDRLYTFSTFPYRMKLYDGKERLSATRIHPFKVEAEEFDWDRLDFTKDKLILMFPHSHAPVKAVSDLVPGSHWLISMPCCFKDNMDMEPVTSYRDPAVLSEKNLINIYQIGR